MRINLHIQEKRVNAFEYPVATPEQLCLNKGANVAQSMGGCEAATLQLHRHHRGKVYRPTYKASHQAAQIQAVTHP